MRTKLLLSLLCILSFSVSCEKSSIKVPDSSPIPPSPPPESKIELSKVTQGTCLSMDKVTKEIARPEFNFPGASVVTGVKFLSDVDDRDMQFFSHTLFNYRRAPVNELLPFNMVIQKDCKNVYINSASGRSLHYRVDQTSKQQISVKLVEISEPALNETQKAALLSRPQPYSYTLTYITPTSVKVVTRFKTFEPICNKRRIVDLEKTEIITWAEKEEQLPKAYEFDGKFLSDFDKSLSVPFYPGSQTILSTTMIEQIQRTPILENLKICGVK